MCSSDLGQVQIARGCVEQDGLTRVVPESLDPPSSVDTRTLHSGVVEPVGLLSECKADLLMLPEECCERGRCAALSPDQCRSEASDAASTTCFAI